jgi:hypothetical protein
MKSKNPEETNKKFFPADAKVSAPKKAGRPFGRPAKKIPDNHIGAPASKCYSMREQFDIYVTESYNKITDDQRRSLWQSVSMEMLSEPSSKLEIVIKSHLSKK